MADFTEEARELEAELRVYWPVSKLTVPMLAEALRAVAERAFAEGQRNHLERKNPYAKPTEGER